MIGSFSAESWQIRRVFPQSSEARLASGRLELGDEHPRSVPSSARRSIRRLPCVNGPLVPEDVLNSKVVPATGWPFLLPWYDPLVSICTGERHFKEHILQRIERAAGLRIVDVGCGTGTLALAVQRLDAALHVTAVDADPRILRLAARKPDSQAVQWVQANATRLPQSDASVDVILCTLLFHHLTPDEKSAVLHQFARVLVPGGRLIMADYCRPAGRWPWLRFQLVRLIDGFERTRCNLHGRLPILIAQSGLHHIEETLELNTLLGTLRCFEARKP